MQQKNGCSVLGGGAYRGSKSATQTWQTKNGYFQRKALQVSACTQTIVTNARDGFVRC
jgi:hypothetical protein